MKFPYVDRGYSCPVPIIPVTIGKGDQCVVTEALVDSGAGRSIFDAAIAEAIGLKDIETGIKEQFEGVSGSFLYGFRHDVDVTIGGNLFTNISIAFSSDMPDNATNILGQQDFFALFPVKFTYGKKQVELMAGSK